MKIVYREFLKYKFLNSLFLGLSIGSIFVIYTPLEPSIYSAGGILLALSMLLIAKLYSKILNIEYFYRISLLVELVLLFVICFFLISSYAYVSALVVYIGYQVTFSFGSYLVRAETIFLRKTSLLSIVDVVKQKGYLLGMLGSYVFYEFVEKYLHITDKQSQVYNIHMLLLGVELSIIFFLIRSFKGIK